MKKTYHAFPDIGKVIALAALIFLCGCKTTYEPAKPGDIQLPTIEYSK